MLYEQKNLEKILEYGVLSEKEAYEAIAQSLNLDFFYEDLEKTYTISSSNMVLDIIKGSCNLVYVDEKLNEMLKYIENYLKKYINNKKVFYYLLKYIVHLESTPNGVPIDTNITYIPSNYKTFCECILNGEYCIDFNIIDIQDGYNIFTHRFDSVCIDPFYVYLPEDLCNLFESDLIANNSDLGNKDNTASLNSYKKTQINLFNYFSYDEIDKSIFDKIPFVSSFFDDGQILIKENEIFISDVKSHEASFMFKKGCKLCDCLKFLSITQSKVCGF